MPLIDNIVEFNDGYSQLINDKLADPEFEHTSWGDDELQGLRSAIRTFYRSEQVGICAYCNNDVSLVTAGNAHIEHIAPKSLYPNFIFEPKNLCVVCSDCNTIKRNQEVMDDIPDTLANDVIRYPRSSNAFKIVHPHFDDYETHIRKKGRIYIDRTPKGSFTIGACKLNRYFHQFGVDDEFIDDEELIGVMNNFMEGRNAIQKARALNQLRDMLFDV